MAYPGIFLGEKRPNDKQRLKSVYYSEICKSELRQYNRRAAMCVENIFFKAKKLQMKLLLGQSQIALRKCKVGNITLTAGQLKTPEGIGSLICYDEGYKFLRALRGSPPYFEKAKKRPVCHDSAIRTSITFLQWILRVATRVLRETRNHFDVYLDIFNLEFLFDLVII